MDAIKTAALPTSPALVERVCCFGGIMLTEALIEFLSSSEINTIRTDTISNIRTIRETGNSSAAGIEITSTTNSIRKAISS